MIKSVKTPCEVYFDEEKMTYNARSVDFMKLPVNNRALPEDLTRYINSFYPDRWEFSWSLPVRTIRVPEHGLIETMDDLLTINHDLIVPDDGDLYELHQVHRGKVVVWFYKQKLFQKAKDIVDGEFLGFARGGARIVLKNLEPSGMVEKILALSLRKYFSYYEDRSCMLDGKEYVYQLTKYDHVSNELVFSIYDY